MSVKPRHSLPGVEWLRELLERNSSTAYLRKFGSPRTIEEFRSCVPVCRYEDLDPYLNRIQKGESDVLFAGVPIAYERTSGSSRGPKLIPYSAEGLLDFQKNVLPWLAQTMARHNISGQVYFSISPATRQPEYVGQVPVGLTDAAYLGQDAGIALMERSAVPFEVGLIANVDEWREATVRHLAKARNLELISVWSPTFLLRLLDHLPDPQKLWPKLKVVSCWASGSSREYAEEIQRLLPHAEIEPKGLLSTEAVVTTPDQYSKPVLVEHGFVEFAQGNAYFLEHELKEGELYEVLVTTASGLYRYCTADCVVHGGRNHQGCAILEFVARTSLTCDLVGEKLTESFVNRCLSTISGFSMLIPATVRPGYVLVCENQPTTEQVQQVEISLDENPQYSYALRLGQLAPLRVLAHPFAGAAYEQFMLNRGTRLGDLKPVALRCEPFWLQYFEEKLK